MAITTRVCDESNDEVMSLVKNVMEKPIFH